MNTSQAEPVAGQDKLNLRPLPNKLGGNGPYLGGFLKPIEQDADRIAGHSTLFRDIEDFEGDLREAIETTWEGVSAVQIARLQMANGVEPEEDVLDLATATLDEAFRWMQEAYLIAEVLNERESARIRARDRADFLALVSQRALRDMTALEALAEEARINWQMGCLMRRLKVLGGTKPSTSDDALRAIGGLVAKLGKATATPEADALQALNDNDLAAELATLEERSRATKKAIGLIHAIRMVRSA